MTQPQKITASDIRAAMRNKWTAQEWAILWEVNEATGAQTGRAADAVMMSLWPSRGLELHGVEIKVSRSDWKREALDPTKAEAVAKYCDRWWVHTPSGLIDDVSSMPPAWGLREWSGKQWKTVKEAELTDTVPVGREFLASLLRRTDKLMKTMASDANEQGRKELEKERQRLFDQNANSIKREVDRRTSEFTHLKKKIDEFEETFGKAVGDWNVDMTAIARAALSLSECRDSGYGVSNLPNRLRATADALDLVNDMTSVKEEAA